VVQGINMRTKHQRQVQSQGRTVNPGIIRFEAALDISNVMLVCKKCNKPLVSAWYAKAARQNEFAKNVTQTWTCSPGGVKNESFERKVPKRNCSGLDEIIGFNQCDADPTVTKVVVNIGLGEAMDNPKALDAAVEI
jgi:ribosomal protein L24